MTSTTPLSPTPSEDEILRRGMQALRRELGLVGMIRCLQKVSPGTGDYTADVRNSWAI